MNGLISRLRLKEADVMIGNLQNQLKDNEYEMELVIELKEELHEAGLRLNEADVVIESLHQEMKLQEEEWWAKVDSLWWQIKELENGRSTMGLSPPSHYSRDTDLVVENPSNALVIYVPPPTYENVTSPILRNDGGNVESVGKIDTYPSQAMDQNVVLENCIESKDSVLLGDFDWDEYR
ncbi:hypothetical protein Dimus_013374 [Dionaea muscipula]